MDGLDEVKPEHRESCAEVINQFIQEGSCPIAICSRIQEYKALKILLKLNTAILLQPLSNEQIEYFLDAGGSKLSGLKDVLKEDSSLRELAKTPLMLSVMGLAYEDEPIDRMTLERTSLEERRKHIFENYASKMFSREARSKSEQFTREQTIEWLSWLAKRMREAGQTIFLLEEMQPTWLKSGSEIWTYSIFVGLSYGIGLFFFATIFYFDRGLISAIGIGLLFGIYVFFGVTVPIRFSERNRNRIIKPKEKIKWSLNNYLNEYQEFNTYFEKIEKVYDFRTETNTWAKLWKLVIKFLIKMLKFYFIIYLILFMIFFIFILLGSLISLIFLPGPIFLGFLLFLFFYFLSFLESGLSVEEIGNKTYPNQGIWESIKNCVMYLFFVNLFIVSCFIILYFHGPWNSYYGYALLSSCLFIGNIYAFIFMGGGMEVVRHYCLRLGLYLSKETPWNYAKFLDSCVDRILLRKVGGGYIFIHRMLMEYFADLENKPIPEAS